MKKHTYGPDNQHFTSSSLLIVFNRVFSVCVGLVILFYKVKSGTGIGSGGGSTGRDRKLTSPDRFDLEQAKQMPQAGSFSSRLKPASPMVA